MILKNKNNKKRFVYIISALLLVLILTVVGILLWNKHTTSVSNSETEQALREENKYVSGGINYAPPTDADKQANDEQEKKNTEREKLNTQANPTNAEIVVTDATQYDATIEVRSYVSNLYEQGGTCTATFTKADSSAVTVTRQAMPDAKTIQCGALNIPRSSFPSSGSWSVVVSYTSDKASGKSNSQVIQIK